MVQVQGGGAIDGPGTRGRGEELMMVQVQGGGAMDGPLYLGNP